MRPDLTEKLLQTFGWVFSITDVDQLDSLTEHRRATIALRDARPDYDDRSDREIWAHLEELRPLHRTYFQEHLFASTLVTVPVGAIQNAATAVGRPDLIMPLLSGVGKVDSAQPSYAMWELSRLDPTSEEFRDGFDRFRVEYGSRGPNEWEARSPTWETDPDLALVAIEQMRGAPESADPHRPAGAACRRASGRGRGAARPGRR